MSGNKSDLFNFDGWLFYGHLLLRDKISDENSPFFWDLTEVTWSDRSSGPLSQERNGPALQLKTLIPPILSTAT